MNLRTSRILGRLLAFLPEGAQLDIDFGQVCFKREFVLLPGESSDCRFDVYAFLYVWAVNKQAVPTAIKQWKFSVSMGRENMEAEHVEDISGWQQRWKLQPGAVDADFKGVKDISKPPTAFPTQELARGVPAEGWVCFVIRGTKESWIENGTIQLTATDSFGHEHTVSRQGPWNCNGAIVKIDLA